MFSILVLFVSTKRRAELTAKLTVVPSRGYMLGFYVVIHIAVLATVTTS